MGIALTNGRYHASKKAVDSKGDFGAVGNLRAQPLALFWSSNFLHQGKHQLINIAFSHIRSKAFPTTAFSKKYFFRTQKYFIFFRKQ